MKESNNQLERNALTEDENKIIEEINTDPLLSKVRAPKGMKEAVMRKIYEQQHPEIYDGMSEEDKEALRLGRELLAKRKEEREKDPDILPDTAVSPRTKKSRKSRKFKLRVCALVAVMVMTILAVGITSIGGPQHLAEMVDRVFEGRSQISINTKDAEIIEADSEEERAYQKVKDELGFDAVRFCYKPKNMKFVTAQLDSSMHTAFFVYQYNEKKINYNIMANYTGSSLKIDIEDPKIDEYTISLDKADVLVKRFMIEESKEIELSAQFAYKDIKYVISGVMDQESFDEIIKNLKFY